MKRPLVWIAIGYIFTILVVSFAFSAYFLILVPFLIALFVDRKAMLVSLIGVAIGFAVSAVGFTIPTTEVIEEAISVRGTITERHTSVVYGEGHITLEDGSEVYIPFACFGVDTAIADGSYITANIEGAFLPEYSFGRELRPVLYLSDINSHNYKTIKGMAISFGDALSKELSSRLSEHSFHLASSVAFGKNELTDDMNRALIVASLSHIVAVSGQHLMIIAVFFGYSKKKKDYRNITVLLAALAFTLITGASPSTIRAFTMLAVIISLSFFDLTVDSLEGVSIAILLIGIYRPLMLFEYSFLMSIMAVVGIAVISPILNKTLFHNKQNAITNIVSITIGAQLGVLPLLIYLYGGFSVLGIVTNIVFSALVMLIISMSYIVSIAGLALPFIADIIAVPLEILLEISLKLIYFFGEMDFFYIAVRERWGVLIALVAFLIPIAIELYDVSYRYIKNILIAFILLLTCSVIYNSTRDKGIELIVINDGEAAVYVEDKELYISNLPHTSEGEYQLHKTINYIFPSKIYIKLQNDYDYAILTSLITSYQIDSIVYEDDILVDDLIKRFGIKSEDNWAFSDDFVEEIKYAGSVTKLYWTIENGKRFRLIGGKR